MLSSAGPDSIWKGNEPRPDKATETCELLDKPNVHLFFCGAVNGSCKGSRGGSGRLARGASTLVGNLVLGLNSRWFKGEWGRDRTGLFEIGDGGTKGKDSRIESAVFEIADDPEIRLILSPPCACACACACARACCCCCCNVPGFSLVGGVTKWPIVVR